MYLLGNHETLPKHAAVVLDLGKARFIFEDTRYFGKLSLDTSPLERLGPEPLDPKWRAVDLLRAVRNSRRPIKTVLLDQAVVAGIGNIYASEALFRAGIDPRQPANRVAPRQAQRLWKSIRSVLRDAIRCGSTIPLRFSGSPDGDGFFYFGKTEGASEYHTERLRVYDRHRLPCRICRTPIARIVQASRSTFFCPRCQPKQRTISASKIRGST
jgi:formamidopyrimidine-DNA glycosylase